MGVERLVAERLMPRGEEIVAPLGGELPLGDERLRGELQRLPRLPAVERVGVKGEAAQEPGDRLLSVSFPCPTHAHRRREAAQQRRHRILLAPDSPNPPPLDRPVKHQ